MVNVTNITCRLGWGRKDTNKNRPASGADGNAGRLKDVAVTLPCKSLLVTVSMIYQRLSSASGAGEIWLEVRI